MHGTTLYVGETQLDTIFGRFRALVFQDLITKGYIIALCFGDIHQEVLATRIHSSCVTSETLGSQDCDCVQQLHGAMERIAKHGAGILFYLIQEGRGAGYVCKARDRMHVQAHREQVREGEGEKSLSLLMGNGWTCFLKHREGPWCAAQLSTYDVYRELGLHADYRRYDHVADISRMLGIHPRWVLLTNNPDKVAAFEALEQPIERCEKIDSRPNPFNIGYLRHKKKYGHDLPQATEEVSVYDVFDLELVTPFEPRAPADSPRFVYCASYYLPIKPVRHRLLVTAEERDQLATAGVRITSDSELRGQRWIEYDPASTLPEGVVMEEMPDGLEHPDVGFGLSEEMQAILIKPHWFRVHLYYDLVRATDLVLLEYADPGTDMNLGAPPPVDAPPVVRYHSESVFNRFPLTNLRYKRRYQRSVHKIVENGWGFIALFYHDGRGHGLGSLLVDAASRGMVEDTRDFAGASWVLKQHLRGAHDVRLLSSRQHPAVTVSLEQHGVRVLEWVYVGDPTADKGHALLEERVRNLPLRVREALTEPVPDFPGKEELPERAEWIVTGVGSSESHGRYLASLLHRHTNFSARFVPLASFLRGMHDEEVDARPGRVLVVISQGLSPNSLAALGQMNSFDRVVLLTSVTPQNRRSTKVEWVRRVENHRGGVVVTFPMEDEYTVLVRVVGPVCGFARIYQCVRSWFAPALPDPLIAVSHVESAGTREPPRELMAALTSPSLEDVQFVAPPPLVDYLGNVAKKFEEGMMLVTPDIADPLSFPHGRHQLLMHRARRHRELHRETPSAAVIVFDAGRERDAELARLAGEMVKEDFPAWTVRSTLPVDLQILEFEAIFSHVMLNVIVECGIDQVHWEGHDHESPLYFVHE